MSDQTLTRLLNVAETALKSFLVAFLTIVTSQEQGILQLTEPMWKAALNAGLGAAAVVVLNWINPHYQGYGRGSE